MPEIVATSGSASANSYITLADALTYFDARPYSDDFRAESEENIQRFLIQAAKQMQNLSWLGERATTTQALAWPRIDCPNPDDVSNCWGRKLPFPSTVIPQRVKEAQCELAEAIRIAGDSAFSGVAVGDVQSFRLGDLSISRSAEYQTQGLPPRAAELLRGMLSSGMERSR